MLDENNVLQLYYDPKINRFTDDMGSVRNDIYRFVTPSQVLIFKQYKNMYLVNDRTNSFMVELIYPEEWMDLDY